MSKLSNNQELFVYVLVAALSAAMLLSVAASARVSTLVDRSSSHAIETEEFIASIDDLIVLIDSQTLADSKFKVLPPALKRFERTAQNSMIEENTIASLRKKLKQLCPDSMTSTYDRSELRSQLLKLRMLESRKVSSLLSEWHGEAFLLSIFVALIQILSILVLGLCILLQRRLQAQSAAAQKAAMDLARLVKFSHESIFSVDQNCRIASWNPASERMFACHADGAIGKPLKDWIKKDRDAQMCESVIRAGNQSSSFEIEMRRTDGKTFWASISMSPIASSGADGTEQTASHTIVASDITERVNLRIQQADFVASLTHDLKNPIIANNLALKHLMDSAGPPPVNQIAGKVIKSNEQMIGMLTAMLDLYKVNSGRFSTSQMPVIIPRLISDCVECFQQRADMKNLTIESLIRCRFRCYRTDPLIVKKIVLNLLDNALKFAPSGSVIRILAEDEQSELIIAVEDSGPGITDARLSELFCIQSPQPACDAAAQSTGLGLYLVKQLCMLIDSEISYKRLDSGVSRFELRLLKSSESEPESESKSEPIIGGGTNHTPE
jgi:PAS domain S-box-containing protein